MKFILPIFFSFLAALGNALFAAAQKKAAGADNPFTTVVASAIVCVLLAALTSPLFGKADYGRLFGRESFWVLAGGVGLYLTYLGFNLLYTRCGASFYVIYAVLSIVTTALVVGGLFFKECLNCYHWAAIVTALITVALFTLGQNSLE
jgi:drug/metabolite transporter (DMT)-like permease